MVPTGDDYEVQGACEREGRKGAPTLAALELVQMTYRARRDEVPMGDRAGGSAKLTLTPIVLKTNHPT
jgi:hypothetical protein